MNMQNVSNQMNFKGIATMYKQGNMHECFLKRIDDDVLDFVVKKNNMTPGIISTEPNNTKIYESKKLERKDKKFVKDILKSFNFKKSDIGKIKSITILDSFCLQISGTKGFLNVFNEEANRGNRTINELI